MATKLGTILADFTTSLATELIVGGTSATLSSATDDDGVALPSGRYFFTLDGSNSSKEHISCDLVGTALTNIKSLSRQGVETTGVVRKHRIGSTVSLTDFGHIKFINDLISGATTLNASAPLEYDGAPTLLSGNQLATLTYVLSVVNGGPVSFDKVVTAATAGETVAAGNLVYFDTTSNNWKLCDADTAATVNNTKKGIAQGSGTSGNSITGGVLLYGLDSNQTGMTVGDLMYSSNTAGGISSSTGTTESVIGIAYSATQLYFDPYFYYVLTAAEKSSIGTATPAPTVRTYTANAPIGSSSTQFDITNPSGTTFRYTYDGTGTDPSINATTFPVNSVIDFRAQNFDSANNGLFKVTGSGANYVEVTNASGVAESNKTIGTGYVAEGDLWTKPAGLNHITVELVGGGAGGAGIAPGVGNTGAGGGGGAGGYCKKTIAAASLAATENVFAGYFGEGGTTAPTAGSNGLPSRFSTTLTANGGTGAATDSNGGAGGTATGGDINSQGDGGQGGRFSVSGGSNSSSGKGGSSHYGGGAASATGTNIGNAAGAYGSGGSGGANIGSSSAGGAGSAGLVVITEYF